MIRPSFFFSIPIFMNAASSWLELCCSLTSGVTSAIITGFSSSSSRKKSKRI
jgi:hypothetical protein